MDPDDFDTLKRPGHPGLPVSYPYNASSMPMPAAPLRPYNQPLFDSRIVTAQTTRLSFFHEGNPYYCEGRMKAPLDFSILGFNFLIESGASEADRNAIERDGIFVFKFNSKIYLELPLIRMPKYHNRDHIDALRKVLTVAEFDEFFGQGGEALKAEQEVQRGFDFTIGRNMLRMRPTDEFSVEVNWEIVPQVSKHVKVTAFIEGKLWKPL